ncbi:hypothetical protein BX616_003630 [Lobosporangium transversale]|uniref:Uncharacterized protein n=1 Tax=Lobosporangium transversale TaxID=64571 RepID=A0A1Y2GE00_9FUNG|nr:hypothetical protein BCR41DRAFT_424817 [Lobosporangium transversale]KAF9916489.1 hypothetical protein BX616_003630 [Lobosporangium transversale]ORZ07219.1 hypothetical protein BCR41DRAFT_424817 [Lobosporangium transversale]|eukprot:XP_021877882.1 hypothetical protein BCR41DRAFT_424817 [Lobosporangium transversale]
MSISIDSYESGSIEGLFGSQVEQRVAHHVDSDDEPERRQGLGRRMSDSKDTMNSINSTVATSSSSSDANGAPTRGYSWLVFLRNPWKKRYHRSQQHRHNLNSNNSRSWLGFSLYTRIPSSSTSTTTTSTITSSAYNMIRKIQMYTSLMITGAVSSKWRKSWFMSLILISVVLTALSGGYLLSQLQHPNDLGTVPLLREGTDSSNSNGLQLDTGPTSGSRRDKGWGKKQPVPAKEDPPFGASKGGETTDESDKPAKHLPSHESSSSSVRICSLEDVANGEWIYTSVKESKQEKVEVTTTPVDQNLSWTGYGQNGCRPHIWNERYLLTPSYGFNSNFTTTPLNSSSYLQADLQYAQHLKNFRWQLSPRQDPRHPNQFLSECQQPEMDVSDFVDILKRTPIVMIGDKFLEQEYLAIECMILGMQDQLYMDAGIKPTTGRIDTNDKSAAYEEGKEALVAGFEYRIESEMPSVIELKIAPGSRKQNHHPSIYRKAKPGQMRLVDRVSNLSLITFIRSDVLWDPGMFLVDPIHKHTVKTAKEISEMEANGLHPDCKVVGMALLCEPARIEHYRKTEANERDKSEGLTTTAASSTSSYWWQWWIGSDNAPSEQSKSSTGSNNNLGDQDGDKEEEEMLYGSDLDHDIINLKWTELLEAIVSDTAEHRARASMRKSTSEEDIERKPLVMISSGHFWEYDPKDVTTGFMDGWSNDAGKGHEEAKKMKALSKAERDQIRQSRDKRKKLLRQQYMRVLTNMLDYIKEKYPDLRVFVQTSVRRRPCGNDSDKYNKSIEELKDQEAALLNTLTKTVVARMQDPLYSFVDTKFLREFKGSVASTRHCSNFMMPGPLDTLVHHLYGELYRLDL